MPVILCQNGDHYEFIGDCFVDGIMEGEAVEASRSGLPLEGSLGASNTLPILDDYINPRPLAMEVIRKLQEENLRALHQQTTILKEVEFDIQ